MNKATSLNLSEIAFGQYGKDFDEIISSYPTNTTCFDALVDADLIRYNPETGLYKPNSEIETFRKNIQKLEERIKELQAQKRSLQKQYSQVSEKICIIQGHRLSGETF